MAKDKRVHKKVRKLMRKHKIRPDKQPNKIRNIPPTNKQELNCKIEGKPVFFDGKLLWLGRAATTGFEPNNLWGLFHNERVAVRDALLRAGYTDAAKQVDITE